MSEPYWKDLQQTSSQQKVRSSLAQCGNHVLTMVSTRVDEIVVRPMLPDGAQLGPPGPDGRYLLVYTFGYQQFVRYACLPPIFSVSYLESIVAVPGILVPGSGGRILGPFGGLGKLYANNLLAWILGRLIGYPKFLSRSSTGESEYRVETLERSPVVSASFRLNGLLVNPFQAASYGPFRALSSLPAVTKTPFGNFLCSVLEIDEAAAVAQPVIAQVEVQAAGFPGLPPGIHTFTGTDAEPLPALRARIPWTLTTTRPEEASSRVSSAGAPMGR
jgi:hypothetical protein